MLPTPEWSFKARNVLQVVLLALKGSMDKKKTNVQFSNVHKLQLCSLRLAKLKLSSKGGKGPFAGYGPCLIWHASNIGVGSASFFSSFSNI